MIAVYYKKVRPDEPAFTPEKRMEDADFDLKAATDILIQPGQTIGVPTNIAIEFPANFEGKIEGKSGLARDKSICILGGVIDHGYTGEIVVLVHNLGKNNILFQSGQKVAQLKIRERSPWFEFKEVQRELRNSQRGDGGFGSTGT